MQELLEKYYYPMKCYDGNVTAVCHSGSPVEIGTEHT
jgi:hypothetical protein